MPKKATKKRVTKKVARKTTKKAVKKATKKTAKKTSKKSVKKVVSKAAKKVKKTAKRVVKKTVKNAPQGQEFFLINGKKVKNYKELARILEHLEDHVFRHHVNTEKNDFANWVRDVFKDIELAKKIAGAETKDKLELVIHRRVVRGK